MVDLDRIIASAQDLVAFFRGVEPDAQVALLFCLVCAYMLVAGLITKLAEPKFEYTVANTMPGAIARGQDVEVLLNGKPVQRCVYANTLTGKVICYIENEKGELYIGADGEPAKEERFGKVEVNFINNTTRGSL